MGRVRKLKRGPQEKENTMGWDISLVDRLYCFNSQSAESFWAVKSPSRAEAEQQNTETTWDRQDEPFRCITLTQHVILFPLRSRP